MGERVEVPDPFKAVRGWTQDYWLLRLLDPRGLDVHGPGGPYDPEVKVATAVSRRASFFNFADRLASMGWVIIWRSASDGSARAIAVPIGELVLGEDTEDQGLGGLVGVAMGLPWLVARSVYKASISQIGASGLVSAMDLIAVNRKSPPAYGRFLATSPEAMAVLESLIDECGVPAEVDLDELLEAAEAAAA